LDVGESGQSEDAKSDSLGEAADLFLLSLAFGVAFAVEDVFVTGETEREGTAVGLAR
jgi:hypothetical protein